MPVLAKNRKAFYEYEIIETYEAGIVLKGHEVKAAKEGKASLKGSYVVFRDEEAYLLNAHIAEYQPLNTPESYDPERTRKLLLKKSQIRSLIGKKSRKGCTIIATKMYTKRGKVKVEIALAKGKSKPDKREDIKKREAERRAQRAMKEEYY